MQPMPEEKAPETKPPAAPGPPSKPIVAFETIGEMSPLFAALSAAQGAYEPILKTRTSEVRSEKANYDNHYAPLDEVLNKTRLALVANGLSFVQLPGHDGDGWLLRSILSHATGAQLVCTVPIPSPETIQRLGSSITYLRRYVAGGMLGVAPETDDDGAAEGTQSVKDRGPRAGTQPKPPAPPAKPKPENAGLANPRAQEPKAPPAEQPKAAPAPAPAPSSPPPAPEPKAAPLAPPPPSQQAQPPQLPPAQEPEKDTSGKPSPETNTRLGVLFKQLGHTGLTPEGKKAAADFLESLVGVRSGADLTEKMAQRAIRLASLHLDESTK